MERRIKRSTVACLLAIGGWSSLQADERFIVQPKRRADTAVVPQKPDAVRWEAADTLWTAPERAGRERSIAGDGATARLATLAPPLELPGQQIEAALRAGDEQAAGQSAPLAGQPTTGKLRWVARGSDPRPSPPTDTHRNSPAVLSTPPQPSSLPFAPAEFPTVPTVAPFAVAAAEVQPITVAIAEPQAPLPATVPHEEIAPKKVLAALVSSQIIAGGPVDDDEQRLIAPVDRPPGWQAVGRELSERLAKCESLINRKAYFSAREDAEAAMLHLVRVLDLLSNRYESEPAWHAARRAMLEAEDFSTAQRLTSDNGFLRRLILSHETPVLKDADVAPLAPLTA
ncbi:MAG: hypothetical protein KDA45_16665, partial [Planctomycetales bacterium]|nr:hypothetical protein [Planctomycetales bacterium]